MPKKHTLGEKDNLANKHFWENWMSTSKRKIKLDP